jgi:hypothetical protein
MRSTAKVTTVYHCTLERAFKTPMLCDISKVHTGFGLMPKVTHVSEDENWGRQGYSKKVFVAPSMSPQSLPPRGLCRLKERTNKAQSPETETREEVAQNEYGWTDYLIL